MIPACTRRSVARTTLYSRLEARLKQTVLYAARHVSVLSTRECLR